MTRRDVRQQSSGIREIARDVSGSVRGGWNKNIAGGSVDELEARVVL